MQKSRSLPHFFGLGLILGFSSFGHATECDPAACRDGGLLVPVRGFVIEGVRDPGDGACAISEGSHPQPIYEKLCIHSGAQGSLDLPTPDGSRVKMQVGYTENANPEYGFTKAKAIYILRDNKIIAQTYQYHSDSDRDVVGVMAHVWKSSGRCLLVSAAINVSPPNETN